MSPNVYVVLGVITYYINKRGRRRQVVLGWWEVVGEYSGEKQAGVLIALFKEYKIGSNIRYFMANNVELNNTYINAVL